MNLKNHDKLIELDVALQKWQAGESGRGIDLRFHFADGLYDLAESVKAMMLNIDGLQASRMDRQRLEENFAEAYVLMRLVQIHFSIGSHVPDLFQTYIDEHCDFMIDQYKIEEETVDYSTMEF